MKIQVKASTEDLNYEGFSEVMSDLRGDIVSFINDYYSDKTGHDIDNKKIMQLLQILDDADIDEKIWKIINS